MASLCGWCAVETEREAHTLDCQTVRSLRETLARYAIAARREDWSLARHLAGGISELWDRLGIPPQSAGAPGDWQALEAMRANTEDARRALAAARRGRIG